MNDKVPSEDDRPIDDTLARWARRGLWLLPVYGVLLALSTLTHQPSYNTDFPAYADYVTTDRFLLSHLVASIGGAALGVIGMVALGVVLARGVAAALAIAGVALSLAGSVWFTAIFAAAAFAQPAIGQAFLDGAEDVAEEVNSDVYGPPLFATFGVGALFFVAGAIVLGVAIARHEPALRWLGIGYAALLPLFLVTGFTVDFLQPVMGAGFAVVTLLLARRLQPTRVER